MDRATLFLVLVAVSACGNHEKAGQTAGTADTSNGGHQTVVESGGSNGGFVNGQYDAAL
jgi:hypothetical protein